MKFKKPEANQKFTISSAADWPSIQFETDETGSHTWNWTISWLSYTKSGKETTLGNKWDAKEVVANMGGTLTVRVEASKVAATISVKVEGKNPSATEVRLYLNSKGGTSGFVDIIAHESKFRHFKPGTEPSRSFDNGYGMCQLTTPAPSFGQVWNWKLNVDGGLKLFERKRSAAIAYLSKKSRSYTNVQLKYETVSRWNGGSYHEWDPKVGKWVRESHILCSSKTGNIGWDMRREENKGKTEKELHKRDSGEFSTRREAGAKWKYSGVCYADRVLG